MHSPYQSPHEPSPVETSWSKIGFGIGIGLFFLSFVLAFLIGPAAFLLGLIAASICGILNHKLGFVSGFFAGVLICIGLAILALTIFCGGMLLMNGGQR